MNPVSPADAARVFRDAVAALSERLSSDYGELVPDASAERTAALLERLEAGATSANERGIRLNDDTREAAARSRIGDDLRAIHALAAPRFERLLEDERETELGA